MEWNIHVLIELLVRPISSTDRLSMFLHAGRLYIEKITSYFHID